MSIIQSDGKREKRRPSLKGGVMFDVWRGQERARAWPKERKKKLHPATVEQNEWFRQAQWATKFMAPEMYWQVANAVQGTPLLPRDILTMMLAGRLAAFTLPSGRTIWSVQVMNEVSEALDVITDQPGALLVRGKDKWIALMPGEADQVLAMDSEGEYPEWQNSGGGGGGGGVTPVIRTSAIRAASGASYTLNYPAGTAVGDIVTIFGGHDYAIGVPAGWAMIDKQDGVWYCGAVFAKIMTSADIAAGKVTVHTGNSGDGVFATLVIRGDAPVPTGLRVPFQAIRSDTGANQIPIVSFAPSSTDTVIVFTSQYVDAQPSLSANATMLQRVRRAGGSGILGHVHSGFGQLGISAQTNYGATGPGYYSAMIAFK